MPDLLTRNEVEKLIDDLMGTHEKLIEELIPAKITMGTFQRILQNLLEERVSIKDLPTILEALSDAVLNTQDVTMLTEQVRVRLSRQICHGFVNHEGVMPVVSLSAAWETEFLAAQDGVGVAMEPSKVQGFLKSARDKVETAMAQGLTPVILCSASSRRMVRTVTSRAMPQVPVLSQNEIHNKIAIQTVSTI
jgi:flagellar biosynthesis protein FlhA